MVVCGGATTVLLMLLPGGCDAQMLALLQGLNLCALAVVQPPTH